MELGLSGSFFGRLAVLTRDHVGGIPSRPVVLRSRRFVLTVMFLCLSQKLRHCGNVKIAEPPSRQPFCNFLQHPAIAIRIMERGEGVITGMLRVRTAGPKSSKQVGLVRTGVHVAAVKHFADFDAATQQLFSRGLNIGDGQVHALGGPRRRRGDVFAKNYRTPGTGRRELNSTPVIASVEIGVEPPPELGVELFGAVYIRNRDDDHLNLHIDSHSTRVSGWFVAVDCLQSCHLVLLICLRKSESDEENGKVDWNWRVEVRVELERPIYNRPAPRHGNQETSCFYKRIDRRI